MWIKTFVNYQNASNYKLLNVTSICQLLSPPMQLHDTYPCTSRVSTEIILSYQEQQGSAHPA